MKTLLLIDGGYYTALQKEVGFIDLLKLKNYLSMVHGGNGKISRGYYVTTHTETEGAGKFNHFVQHDARLTVVEKGTKIKRCHECGKEVFVEKGVDVALGVMMLHAAYKEQYDRLVLVNGDGDLIDALKLVRETLDKEVIIVGSSSSVSGEIKALASELVYVDNPEIYKQIAR